MYFLPKKMVILEEGGIKYVHKIDTEKEGGGLANADKVDKGEEGGLGKC